VELVVAPIGRLRPQITHLFEEVVGATLNRGTGSAAEAYTFACGLTGGSTALIFLGALREADVDWSRIMLYWGDERGVPPDHPDSNYGLAERLLLSPLGARAPRTCRMPGEDPDLSRAAGAYADLLPPALDVLILGVGEDGHVCSLFPGHRALTIEDRPVAAIESSPKPPPRRLTITFPYLLRARHIWVVAVGARKRAVLQHAVSRQSVSTPLDLVVAQGRDVTLFTDQALRRR
jgi:6-phosphogluconolactonase